MTFRPLRPVKAKVLCSPYVRTGHTFCKCSSLVEVATTTGTQTDVVAVGNLCVDVIVETDELPSADPEHRARLLSSLTASPPDPEHWEVGGSTNFMIAAARLGLAVEGCGSLADDMFGAFLLDCLRAEGVTTKQIFHKIPSDVATFITQTLLCFVLVHRETGSHSFCSVYDFGPWPLLQGYTLAHISPRMLQSFRETRAVMLNGFVFDELPADVVTSLAAHARSGGAAIFFDPGPRAWSLLEPGRRGALDAVLDTASVVLVTEEEAAALTGHADAVDAATAILSRPRCATRWCVVKRGGEGCVMVVRGGGRAAPRVLRQPGFEVEVKDSVGCGDSFAAAIVLGYIRGWPLPAVLALANAVGAATARRRGAGRNVADLATVKALLQRGAASASSSDAFAADCASAYHLLMSNLSTMAARQAL